MYTDVGRFLLLARLSYGTLCPRTCAIRSVLWTVTLYRQWLKSEDVVYLRSVFSAVSALEASYENALYKFTFDIDVYRQ